jgi:hypothetical protein
MGKIVPDNKEQTNPQLEERVIASLRAGDFEEKDGGIFIKLPEGSEKPDIESPSEPIKQTLEAAKLEAANALEENSKLRDYIDEHKRVVASVEQIKAMLDNPENYSASRNDAVLPKLGPGVGVIESYNERSEDYQGFTLYFIDSDNNLCHLNIKGRSLLKSLGVTVDFDGQGSIRKKFRESITKLVSEKMELEILPQTGDFVVGPEFNIVANMADRKLGRK